MTVGRRLCLVALVAGALIVMSSPAAQASAQLTQVLTLSPPNLPESIAIDHDENMYLSMPFAGQIVKVTPEGTQTTIAVFPPTVNPLGVRLDHEGNLFVAVAGSGIWKLPAGGGSAQQLVNQPALWNGLAFDHRGNLFVSESGGGAIWRLAKDGAFVVWSTSALLQGTTNPGPCGLVHPAVPSFGPLGANGLAFDKHGDLFAANTDQGTIVRIPLNSDGTAGTASVFAGPSCDLWGADGMAFDNQDNLYVAANAKGQIDRVDTAGNVHVLVAGDPLNFPSDLAFGTGRGKRKQIFITNFAAFPTSSGAPGVLKMDVVVPGRPLE
jgi:sugar lactone lactonase YvrE